MISIEGVHPLLAAAETAMPQVLADLAALVETESPSGDRSAIARSADTVRSVVEARLGETVDLIEQDDVVQVRRRRKAPRVLLLGHHDTVWPVGTIDRIPFALTDGVLRGPGVFDMKVGLVQAIHALRILKAEFGADAVDDVELLITGDEESGSFASRHLIIAEAAGCEAVLVLEASADGGAAKVARKGASIYFVEFAGRAAHSGLEPELGSNAGMAMARVALAASALADPTNGTTVTPTVMTAGTTTNTVPAGATLHLDVRAWSAQELERVDRELRAIDPGTPGTTMTVGGGPDRRPLEEASSSALHELWTRAGRSLGVDVPRGARVGGGSDGNFTAGIGVPTLDGLGAVGGGAHADTEHALVSAVPARTAQLAATIAQLLRLEGHHGG